MEGEKIKKLLSLLVAVGITATAASSVVACNKSQPKNPADKPQQKPNKEPKSVFKINVPGDGSCLFWSVVMAYLLPVRNNNEEFERRFIQLFGEEQLNDNIYNLFKQFDLVNDNQILYSDETMKNLVRNIFRNRVVDYIEANLDKPTQTNKNAESFRNAIIIKKISDTSETVKLDKSDTSEIVIRYLSKMRNMNTWGGEIEILALGNMLNCNINVNNIDIYLANNPNENINLSLKNHHYNFLWESIG